MNGLYLSKLRFYYSKKIRTIFESDIYDLYAVLFNDCMHNIFQDQNVELNL